MSRFAHLPSGQLTSSLVQPVALHVPDVQTAVSPHALPQSPQLFLSLVTSVQTPLQIFFGARHAPSLLVSLPGVSPTDVSPPDVPVSTMEVSWTPASDPPPTSGSVAVAHPKIDDPRRTNESAHVRRATGDVMRR